jgi:hypothetical protein
VIVELGFAPSSWATVPLDPGTRRVLADGHRVIYDTGLLAAADLSIIRNARSFG